MKPPKIPARTPATIPNPVSPWKAEAARMMRARSIKKFALSVHAEDVFHILECPRVVAQHERCTSGLDPIVSERRHAPNSEPQRQACQEGLSSRCQFVPGDLFEEAPSGADLYVLKSVLHDWDEGHCLAILRACQRAMRPTDALLVIERILPAWPEQGLEVILQDVLMLAVTGGKEGMLSLHLR